MKELKDLVVGDDVLVTGMFYRRIAKVDKVTKTQIITNNVRFRSGSDMWNKKSISVPTEKEISDIKLENFSKKLIYAISSLDFKCLSTDELKQVYNIVKGKENEKE